MAESGGVGQQVMQGDRLPVLRAAAEPVADRAIERQLRLTDQQEHGSGRELFAHRGDLEPGFLGSWQAKVPVRHPGGQLRHDYAAALGDRDSAHVISVHTATVKEDKHARWS